jgi:tetratricopeptide (TPR) repeat protein
MVTASILSAASIADLRAAVAKEDLKEISRLAGQLYQPQRVEQGEDAQRQMAWENYQLMKIPATIAELVKLIDEFEEAIKKRDNELWRRKAAQISFLAHRLERANAPDPMLAFSDARNRAQSDPSFANQFALALHANTAKQYASAIEAAEHALLLLSSNRAASMSPEGTHSVASLAANAAFELGKMTEAERYLLLSLSSDNQRWVCMCPDVNVADKLVNAGRREAVIQYFEKAYQLPFPKCRSSISLWLADLKAGKNPRFIPPPGN